MIKKLLAPLSLLFCAVVAIAQPQPTGNLTIFSEDGDKFFLILNGERQNNVAQTNLRVEDLNQPYYTAKIIFEDKTLAEINKNNLMIQGADGAYADVTYKIKKDKNNGKITLKYYSAIPVVQGYVPPANVYVMHYGVASPPPAPVSQTTSVTQTTTTTNGNVNTGADINVGGVKIDVNIHDPNANVTTTQTTTTTTQTNTNTNTNPYPVNEPPHRPVGCGSAYCMSSGDFSSALTTIKNASFEETKLSTAKQIASANCLSTGQIVQICQAFGFEESKLDFAKYAYDFCTETKNYFKINNVFSFSSSTDALNEYVQSKR